MLRQAALTVPEYWWIACGLAVSRSRRRSSRNGCTNSARVTARWREFPERYLTELKRPEGAALLAELIEIARSRTVTLVCSAKDQQHNQAAVLIELLDRNLRKV